LLLIWFHNQIEEPWWREISTGVIANSLRTLAIVGSGNGIVYPMREPYNTMVVDHSEPAVVANDGITGGSFGPYA
jgi:hypothetical protein